MMLVCLLLNESEFMSVRKVFNRLLINIHYFVIHPWYIISDIA